jgi:hypothetical protein
MNLFTTGWDQCLDKTKPEAQVATLSCIWPLMSNIINAAMVLSAVVALYFIIISGIRFISSRGDAQAIDGAKKTLTFAIIGFIFIILSFTLFNFIFTITGIEQDVVQQPDLN